MNCVFWNILFYNYFAYLGERQAWRVFVNGVKSYKVSSPQRIEICKTMIGISS